MAFWGKLFGPKAPTKVGAAKERLSVVIAYDRADQTRQNLLPQMQEEILAVVNKYFPIEREQLRMDVSTEGTHSRLEINVDLPKDRQESGSVRGTGSAGAGLGATS